MNVYAELARWIRRARDASDKGWTIDIQDDNASNVWPLYRVRVFKPALPQPGAYYSLEHLIGGHWSLEGDLTTDQAYLLATAVVKSRERA